MKHVRIKIYGVVQGVWFRQSTKEKALELGLTGWVRNEGDGTVCAEAEGEEEKLDEFIKWCREGSEAAKVDKVEVKDSPELKDYKDFVINY